ncbi:hypothetical protein JXM67_13230 [candidate division WOR-3 bacterium]|nr:hypothetical protein [candidate division WOR-3 bacterium]
MSEKTKKLIKEGKVWVDEEKKKPYIPYKLDPKFAWRIISSSDTKVKLKSDDSKYKKEISYQSIFPEEKEKGDTFYRKKNEAHKPPLIKRSWHGAEADLPLTVSDGVYCRPGSINIIIPGDHEVYDPSNKNRYMESNPLDLAVMRSSIWHELMEAAGIQIQVLEHGLLREFEIIQFKTYGENYIDEQVHDQQWQHLKAGNFSFWPGDPPFNEMAKRARKAEDAAKGYEEHALISEREVVWQEAARRWNEAADYWRQAAYWWERAMPVEAVQILEKEEFGLAFPKAPFWEQRVTECNRNAEEASARSKKASSQPNRDWEIIQHGSWITIKYRNWPHCFSAKVYDSGNNTVSSIEGASGNNQIDWGKGKPAGLYFAKLIDSRDRNLEPNVKEFRITK